MLDPVEARRVRWLLLALIIIIIGVVLDVVSSPASNYCPIDESQLYYTTSGRQPCPRTVTEAVPLCPHPDGSNIAKGLVDTSITYLSDTGGRILKW